MQQEIKAVFIGKVQGVFFRAQVKKYAEGLHLKGYAKNLNDGSVEVRATGDQKDLEKLIDVIKNDPGYARIDHVSVEYLQKKNDYNSFDTY